MKVELTEENASKLEDAGNRWQKYGKDRVYLSIRNLGLELEYHSTGSIRLARWQGESVTNSDGRRLDGSKVFVDMTTGELIVNTEFSPIDEERSVTAAAERYVSELLGE